jgi:hypothetical protein
MVALNKILVIGPEIVSRIKICSVQLGTMTLMGQMADLNIVLGVYHQAM